MTYSLMICYHVIIIWSRHKNFKWNIFTTISSRIQGYLMKNGSRLSGWLEMDVIWSLLITFSSCGLKFCSGMLVHLWKVIRFLKLKFQLLFFVFFQYEHETMFCRALGILHVKYDWFHLEKPIETTNVSGFGSQRIRIHQNISKTLK